MSTPETQAARLHNAMVRYSLSARDLARLMLPESQDIDEIDSLRAQISKWRKGPRGQIKNGISAKNAIRLWGAFERLEPGHFPREYFMKSEDAPSAIQTYQAEIRELREQLERERQEREVLRDELLYEIERLERFRDAS